MKVIGEEKGTIVGALENRRSIFRISIVEIHMSGWTRWSTTFRKKWNKDHRCRTGKVFMIIDSSDSNNDVISNEKATSDEGELMVAELEKNNCEAELSSNVMSGVSKPSTMRLMAWVGKFEVSMLVDSGSSHNFINANIVRKIGL
ncbi:hypothetical protein LWI28_026693 [Acer negundo]|uniref:Uncharacterized protein n=1 Tax=Acer negundo TaxID=4023 RepID=A0AAD5JQP2_ACENE|nr:hypothetical protein LWI28_026693 [Acer negundo]